MNPNDLKRLAGQQAMAARFGMRPRRSGAQAANDGAAYEKFSASELYCAKCRQAMPVREKLLLTLPNGDLFDYLCSGCGTSLGTRNG